MPEFVATASEDEMVLEFIRSEVESPRFNKYYPREMIECGPTRARLVENANILSKEDNALRRDMLSYRGYGARTHLFAGFPQAVTWQRERLTQGDLERTKYARLTDTAVWTLLSASTRLVRVAARNIREGSLGELLDTPGLPGAVAIRLKEVTEQIRTVAALYAHRQSLPAPIAVTDGADVVLVEGHVRATAFVICAINDPLEMIVGHSPDMRNWLLF